MTDATAAPATPIASFRGWLIEAAWLGAMISNAFPNPPKGSSFGSVVLVVVADGSEVVVDVGSDAVAEGGRDGMTYESLVVEVE
ncbi:hypothetical protein BDBG_18070 [Blastomyces gilchristii SLH14081]|uniref:Uncharacterized protein n=1 Tax=Blastomyces gilchristii (strain SLH14081) TaxID=559298 RepID=A0A179V593_BLAGS|nr:uncharacterized protein BDBG_18070 [Blastomyces gilchristii SLH14081]OAT14521.1 hypothetical protein BDBG_18070 [Blastomyces gilchristii SLH14081]